MGAPPGNSHNERLTVAFAALGTELVRLSSSTCWPPHCAESLGQGRGVKLRIKEQAAGRFSAVGQMEVSTTRR
jgi:hypothetical protein